MRHVFLLFIFGVYINSSWGVAIFRKGSPGLRSGSIIHPSSKFFSSFGQKTRRTFSPFPVIQAPAPSFRTYSRYGPSRRTISTRTYRPSRRVYGERPSFGSPSIRRPAFRIRQGSPLSRTYGRNERVMSQRVISPEYFRSRTGSRRTVGRMSSFRGRVPQGVLSGRSIRLRQSSRRPSASRTPEEIIALFAVDDRRNQASLISPSLSRPQLSETIDKGVKAEKIVHATIKTKTKTEDKLPGTRGVEMGNSAQMTDAEAAVVVKDADTVNISVDATKISAPTGNIKPAVEMKDTIVKDTVVKPIVKDTVATAVTDTKADVVVAEAPATIHKPTITQADKTLIVTKQDTP